ncbi:MAG: 50S ribosomal protein L18Ae [Candidatus Jordarchaeum sp.]|uniref:50S ribosomal protein L18Ae n=1 Tax=Candidatus Jordarchaeum sp. TaxID=2823881 RepID=UPI00404A2BBA
MSKETVGVKVFRVKGTFKGKNDKFTFIREIRALNEEDAKEIIYSEIGSNHKVKRNHITIEEIKAIDPKKANNPIIRHLSGLEM